MSNKIIQNFVTVKKYLPAVVIKADITALDDMFNIAEDELVEDILSLELYNRLLEEKDEDRNLLIQCERVISISGFLRAIPDLDLILTQSGFAVHNSESMVPASTARVKSLTSGLQERLDSATDTLIRFLLSSEKYQDVWRNSSQFEKITAGLITNYSEFKDFAQYSPAFAQTYPRNYSEFKRLYSSFNIALLGDIASYLSSDFCNEIIEKLRDRETLSLHEKYVVGLLKYAICAMSLGDLQVGRAHTIKARSYMLKFPDAFPTFFSSPESQALDSSDNSGAIFGML